MYLADWLRCAGNVVDARDLGGGGDKKEASHVAAQLVFTIGYPVDRQQLGIPCWHLWRLWACLLGLQAGCYEDAGKGGRDCKSAESHAGFKDCRQNG